MGRSEAWLLADVGGTGTRMGMLAAGRAGAVREYLNSDFADFTEVVERYCADTGATPACCAVAAAGPERDGRIHMTNLNWTLVGTELQSRLSLRRVELLNDFSALAWATVALEETDLLRLSTAAARPGNRVVLGAGTGLGVAALVRAETAGWTVVSGEGGHVSLAARTAEEHQLIAGVQQTHGHCSAERLLSGPGLSALAAGLGYGTAPPAAVTGWARAGEARGRHVVRVFTELLANVASDLAVTFDAVGGVYLAGGILPKLGAEFPRQAFLERFYDKGRLRGELEAMPVLLMTAPNPALRGLAYYIDSRN